MIYPQHFFVVICFEHRPTWRVGMGSIQSYVVDVSHDEPCLRVLCETGQMRLHRVRRQAVVGVKKKDVFPTAGTEARVARLSQAPIFLSHTLSTGIALHQLWNVIW